MGAALKIGIGGLSLATAAGTGVVIWNTSEPTAQTIGASKDTGYSNKFGEDFKHHMVSATNKDNDAWWDWSFAQRWSNNETSDSNFAGVNSGASLKDKCKDAYGKETKSDMREETKDAYEKSVWRYCSLEGQRPVTLKDLQDKSGDTDSGKIGKIYESDLVSTKDQRNNKFWEIQEKAFFGTEGLGKNASDGSAFKNIDGTKGITLRNKCQEVYDKKVDDAAKDKKDVLAFCSLNPKKSA